MDFTMTFLHIHIYCFHPIYLPKHSPLAPSQPPCLSSLYYFWVICYIVFILAFAYERKHTMPLSHF